MTELSHIKDEWVYCRLFKHDFEEIPDDGGVGNRQYKASRTIFIKLFRCTSCGMKRYETWNAITGNVMFRTYHRPKGYGQKKGEVNAAKLRVEYLGRFKDITGGRT